MNPRFIFQGNITCTACHQANESLKHDAFTLARLADGSYAAYCQKHIPTNFYQKNDAVLEQIDIRFPWRVVSHITLHLIDQQIVDCKGTIATVESRPLPNPPRDTEDIVAVCQALISMADDQCSISSLGRSGEQNGCFLSVFFSGDSLYCRVVDHYWSWQRIDKFRTICRCMAGIYGWDLVDETVPVLDRIINAVTDK